MGSHTQDDGFHEIQLNGKQLVFLFMAATVVSVVIFLCGVLVGRGVRAERAMVDGQSAAGDPVADLRAADLPAGSVDPATASGDPTAAPPPPAVDELSYFNRLESSGPAPEDLKMPVATTSSPAPAKAPPGSAKAPAASEAAQAPVRGAPSAPDRPSEKPAPAPQAAPAAAPAQAAATKAAPAEASGSGFTLQVAALRDRGEADAMADRLTTKGYGAYVVAPPQGAPQVYRVRVGRYATRREAETMAAKLQREEQFTPWITR